jgi:hypothetical protein
MRPQAKYIERFPVVRQAWQVEQDWALELSEFLNVPLENLVENGLSLPMDRLREVCVELMDGSKLMMQNAFYLVSTSKKAIVVFTEHCGHLVLPIHDARVLVDGVLEYDGTEI